MRLYAVADIHGRSDRLEAIKANVEKYRPDLLVAAGDITSLFKISVVSELGDLSLPVLAIRGNTDYKRVEFLFALKKNILFLDNRDAIVLGEHFAGVSGAVPIPLRSRIAFRENAIWKPLIPRITSRTIMIAHPPPWGCLDRIMGKFHAGCKSLESVIRNFQPALLICGHIHEDSGLVCLGKTLIVNCALGPDCGGAIVDIRNGRIAAEILKI